MEILGDFAHAAVVISPPCSTSFAGDPNPTCGGVESDRRPPARATFSRRPSQKTQSASPVDVEAVQTARRSLDPATQDPASLSGRTLRRQTPEVGAVCGNSARTDLRGGTPARAFPTATVVGQFELTHYPPETSAMKPATKCWISAGGRL